MTKFSLAIYHECSTRDSCLIKLNNRKIWNNIYRAEFIIRQAVPLMEQLGMELALQNLLNFLTDYCISIFTTENQMSVYQLCRNLYEQFPIKDKELLASGFPRVSDFMDDYYKITANLYHHQCNFLGYKIDEDYSAYLGIKNKLQREKDLLSSPKEYRRNYYSLFNMTAAGFFFIGKPVDGNITIGTFDKCNNMYLKKIYENIICIYLMLERYLGFYPKITLQVYMSDADRIISLREKEMEQGFDYSRCEKLPLTKRECFFQNMRIPMQNWDDINKKNVLPVYAYLTGQIETKPEDSKLAGKRIDALGGYKKLYKNLYKNPSLQMAFSAPLVDDYEKHKMVYINRITELATARSRFYTTFDFTCLPVNSMKIIDNEYLRELGISEKMKYLTEVFDNLYDPTFFIGIYAA